MCFVKTSSQGGIAGMGTGADDAVASAHAVAIGVGEVIGPMLGGFVVELLPTSLVSSAFATDIKIHDLGKIYYKL